MKNQTTTDAECESSLIHMRQAEQAQITWPQFQAMIAEVWPVQVSVPCMDRMRNLWTLIDRRQRGVS